MPRWMKVVALGFVALLLAMFAALVVTRLGEIRQEEHAALPTPTPDPREGPAWRKTPGGKLWAANRRLFPARERETWEAIAAGRVAIGWRASQCEESWGKPDHVNRTVTALGVHEQWCYGESCNSALYFDGGILTAIQN